MWWGLFGAGGMLAALLLPVHIFLNNIAMPLGWFTPEGFGYQHAARLVQNPLVKLYLVIFIPLVLFHSAHRAKFIPHDLGFHVSPHVLGAVNYLVATGLTVATVIIVLVAP
jgi:fumarate reductase subunit D